MLDDRFWSKVVKTGSEGCWLWSANKNNKGYGLFRPGGTLPKQLAHRVSYEATFGHIPRGALILHSCDSPACVNPAHLRAGTHKNNTADMDARGRRITNTPRGTDNKLSKRTDAEVVAIRAAYLAGDDLDDIAARYGCARSALADYTSGRSWQHLLDATGLAALKAECRRRRRNNARLSKPVADTIRTRLAAGESGRALAREYGVHSATISNIKHGLIWP
jgi:hypothetical protein